jgi:hypothetical protein
MICLRVVIASIFLVHSVTEVVVKVFGSLAQLVEQRTFNPLVAGSNPARPTKYYSEANRSRLAFLFLGPLPTTATDLET